MLKAAIAQRFGTRVERFFSRQINLSPEIQRPEQEGLTQAETNTMGTKDQRVEVSLMPFSSA